MNPQDHPWILTALEAAKKIGHERFAGLGLPEWLWTVIVTVAPAAMLLGIIALIPIVAVYAERKIAAHIQDRLGPYHVGWHGTLQTIADGVKLIFKEDVVPAGADQFCHLLAPLVSFLPVVLIFLAFPFGPGLVAIDADPGLLYILAIAGLPVIGVVLAGWSSNNKFSLLGGLRAAAQLVSYEVALVMSLLTVVMAVGSLNITKIVEYQAEHGWFIFYPWFWIPAIVYFIAGLAETNRTPFDIPEAESELVAGFNTEYSGMKFAILMLAEFAEVIVVSFLFTYFYWGGWDFFGIPLPPVAVLVGKVCVWVILIMVARWTLPRMRVDRLMEMGWKFLIPLSFASIVLVGVIEKIRAS